MGAADRPLSISYPSGRTTFYHSFDEVGIAGIFIQSCCISPKNFRTQDMAMANRSQIFLRMTTMKSFYKTYTESHDGDVGDFYCEVQNGLITRQINKFSNFHYWATPENSFDERYDFTSHPEFDPTTGDCEVISENQFLLLWDFAMRQKKL